MQFSNVFFFYLHEKVITEIMPIKTALYVSLTGKVH